MNAKLLPTNESDRIRVLHEYEILNTATEEEFDRITKIASLVCGTPISLISLVDKDRQWFKSRVGLETEETRRDVSFCQYTLEEDQLMEVEDAEKDERFKSNELVTREPNIRYYAGLPLIDPNGYALGALCVIDRVPRQLDQHQKEILTLLRDEVVTLIVNRKEKEKYRESEQKLKAFFDNSQGLMCTHDLKGNFITVNDAGAKILGYTRDEIQVLSLFDIVPSEGHENLQNYLDAIVRHGTIKGEMRTMTRSGDMRIWMFNNILQASDNKIPYVIGNAVDITEQHFLEKKLKHAQA
jgi:PAS domain S-box-containing protein